ncbi:MAG: hypothetical protein ACRCZ0_00190 [Cetobacterium sp.]
MGDILELEIINHETGEVFIVDEKINQTRLKGLPKVSKVLVDNMLKQAKHVDDVDVDLLFMWLKISKAFNNYNQVKVLGIYITQDYFDLCEEDLTLAGYTMKLPKLMHPFTNILMKNRQTWIRTWTELYEEIGMTNTKTQTKFKKFCTQHDLIRVCKTQHNKNASDITTKLIVNPFLLRKSVHVGQVAIARFGDLVKESINVDPYAVKFLELNGVLDIDRKLFG